MLSSSLKFTMINGGLILLFSTPGLPFWGGGVFTPNFWHLSPAKYKASALKIQFYQFWASDIQIAEFEAVFRKK